MRAKLPQAFSYLSPQQGRIDTILIFYFQSICRGKKRIFKATEHLFSQKNEIKHIKESIDKNIYWIAYASQSVTLAVKQTSVIVAIIY